MVLGLGQRTLTDMASIVRVDPLNHDYLLVNAAHYFFRFDGTGSPQIRGRVQEIIIRDFHVGIHGAHCRISA